MEMAKVDSINNESTCECTSNYALKLALKTMQERCQQLQKRLATAEDENCSLRMKYCREKHIISTTDNSERSEVDILKEKIALLVKQKSQLAQNIMMVAAENRNLWIRLSKLTDVNNSLGNYLIKINDTLNQHKLSESHISPATSGSHLIRSKTFTQHTPRERIEKINIDTSEDTELVSLEEISLKIMNRLLKEKADLEDQCAQMTEIQNEVEVDINSIGFSYPDENDEDLSLTELVKHTEKLNSLKEMLFLQQQKLHSCLDLVKNYYKEGRKICNDCSKRCESTSKTDITSTVLTTTGINQHICPMCNKQFDSLEISEQEFISHVQTHFIDEGDCITDNYEIITTLGS